MVFGAEAAKLDFPDALDPEHHRAAGRELFSVVDLR